MTTAIAILSEVDVSALHGLIQPWSTALESQDWDAALGMCTEDCVFLPPGEPAVPPEGLRAFFEAYPVITEMKWDIDHIEGHEDVATLRGWFDITAQTEEGEGTERGKFVDILRKEDDGRWRFSCIIWNTNEG